MSTEDGGDSPADSIVELSLNQTPARWDLREGRLTLGGVTGVILWTNPSLLHMLKPLVQEVGPQLARMLIADGSREGIAVDYETIVRQYGSDFVGGFLAWSRAVVASGWGVFELPVFEREKRRAVVRVRNAFELRMQEKEKVTWGCPFLMGKLCGLFGYAFGTQCWAEEHPVAGEPFAVDFHFYESNITIDSELSRLREQHIAERQQQLIAQLVRAQTQDLRFRELHLHAILRLSPSIIFTVDKDGVFQISEGSKLARLGLAPGEVVGRSVYEVYKDHPEVIDNIRAVLAGEDRGWSTEVNGVYFDTRGVPLRDETGAIIGALGVSTDVTEQMSVQNTLREGKAALEAELQEKQKTIMMLSTPVIRIWDGVLLLPLIGQFDQGRAAQFMDTLLQAIAAHQADEVIIDITGISVVDTMVAFYLLQSVQAARLLGVRCTLVGISAAMAQTLVHLGTDLNQMTTYSNLESGLKHALARMRFQISRPPRAPR